MTRSPSSRPDVTMVKPSTEGPTSTGLGVAVFFSVAAQTKSPFGPRWIAVFGTTRTFLRISTSSRALMNSPGHSFSSAFAKVAFRR